MNNFALLWGKILDSSIWIKESKESRLVWITMLAMKDFEGKIQASVVGLADRAKVSADECRNALTIFLSPDPDDTSKVEDGKRIREIPGGWQVINHDLYRFSTEAKREFWRQSKADQRKKSKRKPPSEREGRYVKADGDGDTEKADAIAAENLPAANFPEIETVEQCITNTMTAGIPPDFVRFVHADWASRSGKDASGVLVSFLPYCVKRWAREQVEWKNGHHKGNGKPANGIQSRISQEQELGRLTKELATFSTNLNDYNKGDIAHSRILELRKRRKELRELLGVVA